MTTPPSLPFSWNDVESLPDLARLDLALGALPDARIIEALKAARGRGRDDYPVAAMWRAMIAGVVLQHEGIESLLRELSRNPALLTLCGFDPLPRQKASRVELEIDERTGRRTRPVVVVSPAHHTIPKAWNFTRFLKKVIKLESEQGLITAMIADLRTDLMEALPDFGRHLGYDGKAIESHATGRVNARTGKTSDPDADWGRHETSGVDAKTGSPWKKIKSWFGYGLHVIADTAYEIPVAFTVTRASRSEVKELEGMVKDLFSVQPDLAERCQDFSADRGLDSGALKARLWDDYGIRPLIDTRALWREEKTDPGYRPDQPITRSLHPDRADTIVHSEKGEVFCVCPQTGEMRALAFQGFEADRGTLKYRCPAAAFGFDCAGREACHQAADCKAGDYGRVVRIDLARHDRRIFTPTPHGSPSWQRGYNRRSALERINSRIDNSFGFEHHFIRGKAKMQTRVGLALAVMMAVALGHLRAGRTKQMRSLVGVIPDAIAA